MVIFIHKSNTPQHTLLLVLRFFALFIITIRLWVQHCFWHCRFWLHLKLVDPVWLVGAPCVTSLSLFANFFSSSIQHLASMGTWRHMVLFCDSLLFPIILPICESDMAFGTALFDPIPNLHWLARQLLLKLVKMPCTIDPSDKPWPSRVQRLATFGTLQ